MKKNYFRWFSGLLAAALLILLLPTMVSAAVSKIVLSDGSAVPSTILVGQTYALKVSDGTKVNFYSSDESVAIIGKTTGILEPVAPGKVTITAKDAKTDSTVVAKFTFTVLQRTKTVSVGAETLYLSPGDTYSLKPVLTPATSTDVLRFISGDKSIATVGPTSGTVTAKALGETTITIYAKEKATTSNTDPENRTATVRVVVQEKPLKAEVLNGNQIKLTFSEDISGVTAEHFSVTQANTMGVSKTLGIESVVQNGSCEFLLTMDEAVFSETETSTATLYFTSPDDENHMIVVNLGKKYANTSELKSVKYVGNKSIEAGTNGLLQIQGSDKNGDSYPLDNVTVCLYSNVTKIWTDLPETGAVVDKVSFCYKLLSDGSIVVTYAAPLDAAGANFGICLKDGNGLQGTAKSLSIDSATEKAKYSLRFVSPEGEELFEPLTISAGTRFTPPTPAREGYTFKEWNAPTDVKDDIFMATGRMKMPEYDLTLTAVWEYTPSALTASVSTDGWTYGSPVSPTLNNSPEGTSKVTYQYKAVLADDTEWSEAVPAVPGNYQVRAVLADAEGSTVTTAAVYFTISPKAVTITGTAVAPSKVYDGNHAAEITDTGTLDGVADGDDVFIVSGTASYDDETVGTGKTVTFKDFALGGADKDNYVLASQPASVTADITDAVAEVISVNISWDSMEFTYTAPGKKTWNPETHQYENVTAGGWTSEGGNITVTNNGNIGVVATLSFIPAAGMSEISGSFTASLLAVDAGKTGSTTLTLSGAPSAEFGSKELGTVSISIRKYGWISQDGKTYYFDDNGRMATGWLKNDGKWYCFDQNGVRYTGWMVTDGGAWYYFDIDTGIMRTGWLEYGRDKYYFAESTEQTGIGVMCTGWKTGIPGWEGKWFYFYDESTEPTRTGAMCTGWLLKDGTWRYFDLSTGVMCTGWVEIDGARYYFNLSTGMCTGWVEIDGTWYYFDETTGQMVKSSTDAPNE